MTRGPTRSCPGPEGRRMTRGVIHGSSSPAGMTRGGQGVIRGTPPGASRGTGAPIRGTARQVIHGRRVPTRGTTRGAAPGHGQVAGRCRPTRAVTRAAARAAIPGRVGRISTATSGLARHLAPGRIRGLGATRAGTRVLARARCPLPGLAGCLRLGLAACRVTLGPWGTTPGRCRAIPGPCRGWTPGRCRGWTPGRCRGWDRGGDHRQTTGRKPG